MRSAEQKARESDFAGASEQLTFCRLPYSYRFAGALERGGGSRRTLT